MEMPCRCIICRQSSRSRAKVQRETLQNLLVVADDKGGQTPLFWLGITAPKPSANGMYHLLERIAFINDMQLPVKPDNAHPARLRQLAQRGQRYRPQALANLVNPQERYTLLIAYLHEHYQSLIDQLVDMFDRWLGDLMRRPFLRLSRKMC
jgi:hypothetical protein